MYIAGGLVILFTATLGEITGFGASILSTPLLLLLGLPLRTIVIVNLVQGFAISLLIIPGNTVAFLTMPAHLRTSGTSMLTLIRNTATSNTSRPARVRCGVAVAALRR